MSNFLVFSHIMFAASFLCAGLSNAQEPESQYKKFGVSRIAKAPTIDGLIGDSEWAGAAQLTDLHQVKPVEFAVPSERTTWYVAYDDKTLYIAAHAYDAANIMRLKTRKFDINGICWN